MHVAAPIWAVLRTYPLTDAHAHTLGKHHFMKKHRSTCAAHETVTSRAVFVGRFTWIYAFMVIFYTLWLLTVHYKARPTPAPLCNMCQLRAVSTQKPQVIMLCPERLQLAVLHGTRACAGSVTLTVVPRAPARFMLIAASPAQRYMKLHQAYLVTSLEGKDAWKHPTSFSLGIGAAVDDVGYKEYDLRYSHLCNTCLPCQVRFFPLLCPHALISMRIQRFRAVDLTPSPLLEPAAAAQPTDDGRNHDVRLC